MEPIFKKTKVSKYDFDGVMTDNKVYVGQDGKEMVKVSRADGLGVSEIKKLGIEQIIISTEMTNPTEEWLIQPQNYNFHIKHIF